MEIKATHLETINNGHLRFYRFDKPLWYGKAGTLVNREIYYPEHIQEEKESHIKPEFHNMIPDNSFDIVCVSDALAHAERLVFTGFMGNKGYCRTGLMVAGSHTMMIHGGDVSTCKPDEVYLRFLAKLNGYEYKGLKDKQD